MHEAKMHESSIFLTLTYDESNVGDGRLHYEDFQKFMKSLRESVTRGVKDPDIRKKLAISFMVTGEYGEQTKRPHWHAIIFNYKPTDATYKYTNALGDKSYDSEFLTNLWKKGALEFGSVTLESANYVARYAAKKLVHGHDQDHDFHPIHKTSSKRAIGRTWIEKYWKHTFENGFIVLPNGQTAKIPRYYIDWLKENRPDEYCKYSTGIKEKIIARAEKTARKEENAYLAEVLSYKGDGAYPRTRAKVKETVLKAKFKKLQEGLKL